MYIFVFSGLAIVPPDQLLDFAPVQDLGKHGPPAHRMHSQTADRKHDADAEPRHQVLHGRIRCEEPVGGAQSQERQKPRFRNPYEFQKRLSASAKVGKTLELLDLEFRQVRMGKSLCLHEYMKTGLGIVGKDQWGRWSNYELQVLNSRF